MKMRAPHFGEMSVAPKIQPHNFVNSTINVLKRRTQQYQIFAKQRSTTTNERYDECKEGTETKKNDSMRISKVFGESNKILLQAGPSKSIIISHISEEVKISDQKKKYSVYTLAYEQAKHLYNCGENALRSLVSLKYPISHMTHIFISKLTGSALCGLPQLVLNISLSRSPDIPPLQVIGPAGIKNWILHSSLISSSSFGTVEFRELHFPESFHSNSCDVDKKFDFSVQNILRNNDNVWEWYISILSSPLLSNDLIIES